MPDEPDYEQVMGPSMGDMPEEPLEDESEEMTPEEARLAELAGLDDAQGAAVVALIREVMGGV